MESRRRRWVRGAGIAATMLTMTPVIGQQQIVDPDFKAVVDRPAYRESGPVVGIDEAHSNFHTAAGQYKPFADLLTSDGYRVVASVRRFEPGRAQGLAMTFGRGRVVVLGEAALFSAHVITLPDGDRPVTFKAGMNAPGNDNRQFALNVMHWLSRVLD